MIFDIIIILMYIALSAALGATAWAMYRTNKVIGRTSGRTHGVPVRKINVTVCVIIMASLILSFAFASTSPLCINTSEYADTFWLRTANMFVFTGIMAIILAAGATIYNVIKSRL